MTTFNVFLTLLFCCFNVKFWKNLFAFCPNLLASMQIKWKFEWKWTANVHIARLAAHVWWVLCELREAALNVKREKLHKNEMTRCFNTVGTSVGMREMKNHSDDSFRFQMKIVLTFLRKKKYFPHEFQWNLTWFRIASCSLIYDISKIAQ